MTTLNRLLESVFEGKRFESAHDPIPPEKIDKAIKQIPFTLSDAQKSSIFQAFSNDITYIQGPPGTGKSYTISALTILASKLGMKTLVASQKKPAVEIVYSKVSNLLGEEGCLFLTDDQNRKEATKDLLQNLLTLARQEISNKDLSCEFLITGTTSPLFNAYAIPMLISSNCFISFSKKCALKILCSLNDIATDLTIKS